MRQEQLAKSIISLLTGICWHPPVRASWEPDGDRLKIAFEPDSRDMRFCMGANGVLIKGLQFIAKLIGGRNGYLTSITLVQNYDQSEREEHDYVANPRFDTGPILDAVTNLLAAALGEQMRMRIRCGHNRDTLEIKVEAPNENYEQAIHAMEEALAAYGYRNGFLIKISVANSKKQTV